MHIAGAKYKLVYMKDMSQHNGHDRGMEMVMQYFTPFYTYLSINLHISLLQLEYSSEKQKNIKKNPAPISN